MALQQTSIDLPGGRSQTVWRGGDGPPLLWLHGGGGLDPEAPLLARLASGHEVIAPLAPGFADLAELDDVHDVHDLAIHYDDVLEALGIEQAVVAGHSFGGMVAAELAAHYPRRVTRLVLIAPVGLWNDAYPVTDMFAIPFPELPAMLYAEPPEQPANGNGNGAAQDEQQFVESLVTLAQGMTSIAKFMWPIPDKGLSRRLRRVSAPTLVVFGDSDAIVPPRYADDFVAAIPRAEKAIIGRAGHMVPDERTEEVASALDGFLAVA
jgi:pimeloyl-ACP methyl ester carboxylesterase